MKTNQTLFCKIQKITFMMICKLSCDKVSYHRKSKKYHNFETAFQKNLNLPVGNIA